jgi:4-diphosphocytidyl-2-C-methyl-D-erythritol kinase
MPLYAAPAKINLTLEILSRREDGYHTLRSVMVPIGLYDRLTIEPRSGAGLVCDVAFGDDDLVARAARAAGLGDRPYALRLEKRIPIGGGLGGGSSDAAAVLRAAMNGAFGEVPHVDWIAVARSIGSDVPFFLAGTGALVEGTGERVTSVGRLPPWWCVVVRPDAAVPTGPAYRLLDDAFDRNGWPSRPRSTSASLELIDALQRADFAEVEAKLTNDFHDVVVAAYPAVANAVAALARAGAARPLLSGSGSCVFALTETEREAREIADAFDPCAAVSVDVCPLHTDPSAWR